MPQAATTARRPLRDLPLPARFLYLLMPPLAALLAVGGAAYYAFHKNDPSSTGYVVSVNADRGHIDLCRVVIRTTPGEATQTISGMWNAQRGWCETPRVGEQIFYDPVHHQQVPSPRQTAQLVLICAGLAVLFGAYGGWNWLRWRNEASAPTTEVGRAEAY